MRFLLSIAILALWAGNTLAQSTHPGSLTGSLVDSTTRQKIPFANAALYQGTTLITGATTDSEGIFLIQSLPLGKYTLTVSSVGYLKRSLEVVLSNHQPKLELGTLALISENRTLSEVTVSAQKALFEEKGDRLVYNAEKDISNVGGSAADMLRKVPGLSVDFDGTVQMRGNSNIRVLINGKPSALMARNLADALRQMPADNIRSVEIITSPGAKYDAEGSAGVINIITKKALKGFNGSVMASQGTLNRSINTKLALKTNKLGFALTANGNQFRNIRESELIRTTLVDGNPSRYLNQKSKADNVGTGGYTEMSLDYDPDSTNHINFSINAWGGSYPKNSVVINQLSDANHTPLQTFRNETRFRNPYGNSQFDLGYTKTFRKPEQEFSFLTQFSRMPDNYFYDTDRYNFEGQLIFRQKSMNYSRNKEFTLQADYTHPFQWRTSRDTTRLKLELGLKAIRRDIGSEFNVEQSVDGQSPLIPDPTQSNNFVYLQNVYSAYVALRAETKSKFSFNLGTRLERTVIDGDFQSTQTHLANAYNNLIPSITIAKKVGTQTFKTSYTQRIQRPMLWYLNPWVNASDPQNLETGNPYLKPELNHALEVGHSMSTKAGLSVNTALYARTTNNAIEYFRTVDATGVAISKPQNMGQRKSLGLNINVSGQARKNWTLNGSVDFRYIDIYSPALQQGNSGGISNFSVNSTYKFPHNITFQTNANVGTGWINLQGRGTGYYWYGFALKREFWAKKASLTLGVNNPFNRGMRQTYQQFSPTFESTTRSFYVNRSARLAFEWRFGKMATSGKQGRKISNDDGGGR
ncbi:TonB-dependent receptor domain-containing protein [Siphonobacter sp. SORGH_AS_1065]|uniref:TonB-dependent receptor domain-containing protein n=1 Tax=Siphonobacter sp. SORGH_AS_1065 TaxID=3041795 RepID=UPI0027843CF1|nr:TonB-dependent receptor [Siphonobacter sp. SORGH_AS_1065]MDQ1090249.1 outer membrane receptor protein involved in Fe transport [Siphonobacter sp. SORGH_AS_1065]